MSRLFSYLRRHWKLLLAAFVIFMAWIWADISCVDYAIGESEILSVTTAGWFIMGLPLTAVIGTVYATCVVISSRWTAWVGPALFMLPVGLLFFRSYYESLPSKRIIRMLGPQIANETILVRLRTEDSFNGGINTIGCISGPDHVLNDLASRWSMELEEDRGLPNLQAAFPGIAFDDRGSVYSNDTRVVHRNAHDGRIYFHINYEIYRQQN